MHYFSKPNYNGEINNCISMYHYQISEHSQTLSIKYFNVQPCTKSEFLKDLQESTQDHISYISPMHLVQSAEVEYRSWVWAAWNRWNLAQESTQDHITNAFGTISGSWVQELSLSRLEQMKLSSRKHTRPYNQCIWYNQRKLSTGVEFELLGTDET